MDVKIQFAGIDEFIGKVDRRAKQVQQDIKRACTKSAVEWSKEAKLRAPVDTGLTRNTVLHDVEVTADKITCSVGSNQKHAKYIEFGNEYIAGGAVEQLGTRPDITDQEAIHTWAAKEENATGRTSHSANLTSDRLHNRAGDEIAGKRGAVGMQEQMPWLRPAFMVIRHKVLRWLQDVLREK